MIASTDIKRSVRKAIDQDGLFELCIGLSFLATTLLVAIRVPWLTGLFTVLMLTVALPVMRTRLTYPRIGYAKPHEPILPVVLGFVLGIAAVSLAVMALVLLAQGRLGSRPAWSALMPLGFGIFVAGFHLLWGMRCGTSRHYVLAAAAAAGGAIAVLASGGDSDAGAGMFFIGFGVLQVSVGLLLLVKFLARNPKPAEVANDA